MLGCQHIHCFMGHTQGSATKGLSKQAQWILQNHRSPLLLLVLKSASALELLEPKAQTFSSPCLLNPSPAPEAPEGLPGAFRAIAVHPHGCVITLPAGPRRTYFARKPPPKPAISCVGHACSSKELPGGGRFRISYDIAGAKMTWPSASFSSTTRRRLQIGVVTQRSHCS